MTKSTILVATWQDGLFVIAGDSRAQEIANQPVRGLTGDGRGGALAIVGQHSLRRRSAGGEWHQVATSEFALSCCMAVGETIYVGTDDARMLRLDLRLNYGAGLLDSGTLSLLTGFESVGGRDTWFAGSAIVNGHRLGPPLGVRSVAANSNGSVLFANVHVGGIPRSLDSGKTWQPTIDIGSDVHEVCAHPTNPDIIVAAAAVGLCVSRDSGASWIIQREGLHASHCAAVAFSGDDILISAATDPFAAEGRVYRRAVNKDGSLKAIEESAEGGMPAWTKGSADTGCISANGSSVAIADRGGNLYTSDDFGRTWLLRSTGLPTPSGVLHC